AASAVAAPDCPAPGAPRSADAKRAQPADGQNASGGPRLTDQELQIEADSVSGTREGAMLLEGDVVISQGERQVRTRNAVYDNRTQSLQVENGVEYSDPALRVSGSGAHVDPEGATFEGAQFELSTA